MKKALLGAMGLLALAIAPQAHAQNANATSAAPAYKQGTNPLSQDLNGNLRVITAGGGTGGANNVASFSSSLPALTSGQATPLQTDSSGRLLLGASGQQQTLSTNSTATFSAGTTAATAGTPSTFSAAGAFSHGFVLQNTCGTAEWFSVSLTVGTTLTAVNSLTLAPGATFTSPDWYPISGAIQVASATAVACTFVGFYK